MARTGSQEETPRLRPAAPKEGWGWLQTLDSLRYPNYRLVWITSVLSSAARWVQQLSLGWLVFDLTESALLLGSILFVYQAPTVLLSPLIGVLVDRVDRRGLFILSQIGMAGVAALLAADIALGLVQPWHLFIFALVSGVESTIIHVLRQALIPSVVPGEALMNAIALNSAALTSTRIATPFLAGLLIVTLGVSGNFLIQAVLLIGVAAAAFPLNLEPLPRGEAESAGTRSVWEEIAVGLRYIWGIEALRLLFVVQFVHMLTALPVSGFLPVWADAVLKVDADGLGLLYAGLGIGALVGTVAIAGAGNVRRKEVLQLGAFAGVALALLGLGASPTLALSLVFLALLGTTQSVFSTVNMTLVQSRVPAGLQGRVMSVYNVGHGMIALGSLIMGALITLVEIQVVVAGLGLMLLVLTLVYLATRYQTAIGGADADMNR